MKYLIRALLLCACLGTSSAWAQSFDGASLTISSYNGYEGGTLVTDGAALTLSAAVTQNGVYNSALLLGGTGIGTVSIAQGAATLTFTGPYNLATINNLTGNTNAVFNSSAYFNLNLNSPSTGATLPGSVTLNSPTLTLQSSNPGAVIAPGTTFNLFTYQGTETGTFMYNGTALTEGSLFNYNGNTFEINYAVGDPSVVVTAVPEPSSVLLFLFGATFLLVTVRRSGTRRKS